MNEKNHSELLKERRPYVTIKELDITSELRWEVKKKQTGVTLGRYATKADAEISVSKMDLLSLSVKPTRKRYVRPT